MSRERAQAPGLANETVDSRARCQRPAPATGEVAPASDSPCSRGPHSPSTLHPPPSLSCPSRRLYFRPPRAKGADRRRSQSRLRSGCPASVPPPGGPTLPDSPRLDSTRLDPNRRIHMIRGSHPDPTPWPRRAPTRRRPASCARRHRAMASIRLLSSCTCARPPTALTRSRMLWSHDGPAGHQP